MIVLRNELKCNLTPSASQLPLPIFLKNGEGCKGWGELNSTSPPTPLQNINFREGRNSSKFRVFFVLCFPLSIFLKWRGD